MSATTTIEKLSRDIPRQSMKVPKDFHALVKREAEKRGMTMEVFLFKYGSRLSSDC